MLKIKFYIHAWFLLLLLGEKGHSYAKAERIMLRKLKSIYHPQG